MNKIKKEISVSKEELKKELESLLGKGELTRFQKFAFKGKMMEMSIAFIIGSAFQKSVESISSNLIMPFVNFFILQTGENWRTYSWTPIEGMTFNIGNFLGTFVDFIIISIVLYVIYIKLIKPLFSSDEEKHKLCPQCMSHIPVGAKRCQNCTSWLNENE